MAAHTIMARIVSMQVLDRSGYYSDTEAAWRSRRASD